MPKTKAPKQLETIDLAALEGVSGGRTSATAAQAQQASSGSSSGGRTSATAPTAGSTDPMMQLLMQIETSLQGMAQQNQSQDPLTQALMMMQMMNGGGTPR
jgi:hypothetical protein